LTIGNVKTPFSFQWFAHTFASILLHLHERVLD
jgi:hypothetical protein